MGKCIVVMKLPVTTCPQLQPFSSSCILQPVKDFDVILLSYYLAWRSVLMVDNTSMIKKETINMAFMLLRHGRAVFGHGDSGDFHWED
jgi:hypothetical protein